MQAGTSPSNADKLGHDPASSLNSHAYGLRLNNLLLAA